MTGRERGAGWGWNIDDKTAQHVLIRPLLYPIRNSCYGDVQAGLAVPGDGLQPVRCNNVE